ncbi:YdeI/OmpD-associated family protein [Hymenobacter sp. ASUV-10]|uniref:YdeI/OmpD-associated family protein n=1 Tax=Hymenobacter aranciens TaxID=3063996 RepID=A0ABT9BE18_9BACT|nr:YdeI/OmpD-associated family protein [Hymenobacter sp. ASUV-10]MDO7874931.1 YdeI/OmpD-associated family protein [Hymenobacter sp. ASUV-10]
MPDSPAVTFRAVLEHGGPSFMPTQIIVVPETVRETLGKKAKRVLMTIGRHTERLGLLPLEGGGRYLMLRKSLCKELGIEIGQELSITLTPDPDPDRVDLPDELLEALAAWPEAQAAYEPLNGAMKRAMVRQIEEAKTPDTRARRAVQMVEKLARGGHPFRTIQP